MYVFRSLVQKFNLALTISVWKSLLVLVSESDKSHFTHGSLELSRKNLIQTWITDVKSYVTAQRATITSG